MAAADVRRAHVAGNRAAHRSIGGNFDIEFGFFGALAGVGDDVPVPRGGIRLRPLRNFLRGLRRAVGAAACELRTACRQRKPI